MAVALSRSLICVDSGASHIYINLKRGYQPMDFTNAQLEKFREHGFLPVPDFWTENEVEAMRAELDRLKSSGIFRNVATVGDGETEAKDARNLQLCPMYPHSSLYRAMPFADKVVAAVGQLIGDPVLLHLDQMFLKPARSGSGTNWHQDNAYFRIDDPLKGTAMWTAVHEARIDNGTIHVIPGSFRTQYEHSRDPYSNHHIRCYPPEESAVPVELPTGGVVFFAYGIAHATRANKTDNERAGIAHHFINAEMDKNAQIGYESGGRPILSGPDTTGGERELGVKVSGTWEKELARVLA